MKCFACGFDGPTMRWMQLKDVPTKTPVAPRVNYYALPSSNQYDRLYACPKCGTVKIRKIGEK